MDRPAAHRLGAAPERQPLRTSHAPVPKLAHRSRPRPVALAIKDAEQAKTQLLNLGVAPTAAFNEAFADLAKRGTIDAPFVQKLSNLANAEINSFMEAGMTREQAAQQPSAYIPGVATGTLANLQQATRQRVAAAAQTTEGKTIGITQENATFPAIRLNAIDGGSVVAFIAGDISPLNSRRTCGKPSSSTKSTQANSHGRSSKTSSKGGSRTPAHQPRHRHLAKERLSLAAGHHRGILHTPNRRLHHQPQALSPLAEHTHTPGHRDTRLPGRTRRTAHRRSMEERRQNRHRHLPLRPPPRRRNADGSHLRLRQG